MAAGMAGTQPHAVCLHCGGAGEHPREPTPKELKLLARQAKLLAASQLLEARMRSRPQVVDCMVTPQAPGVLCCAHIVLRTGHGGRSTSLAAVLGSLETSQPGEAVAAPSRATASRFFPGGVHVVAQLPAPGCTRVRSCPWVVCHACGGVGVRPIQSPSIRATVAPALAAQPTPLTVAVIGGGIGGAALALALQQRGISVLVFERDASFHERRQGYGLTMQQGG